MGEAGRECVSVSKRGVVPKEHVAARGYAGTERGDAFNEAIAGERSVVRLAHRASVANTVSLEMSGAGAPSKSMVGMACTSAMRLAAQVQKYCRCTAEPRRRCADTNCI